MDEIRPRLIPTTQPMRLLIDTNVLLDVFLERLPWASEGALVLDAIERGQATGYVASHTVTTLYYVIARARDRRIAATAVSDLLGLLTVVPLDTHNFQHALVLGLTDFEDAVQAAASLKIDADYIVTRNEKDFVGAPVTARSAGEVFALLS